MTASPENKGRFFSKGCGIWIVMWRDVEFRLKGAKGKDANWDGLFHSHVLAFCGGCRHVILKRKHLALAAAAVLDVPFLLAEVSFDSWQYF